MEGRWFKRGLLAVMTLTLMLAGYSQEMKLRADEGSISTESETGTEGVTETLGTEVPGTETEEPGTEIEEPGTETEVPGTEIEEPGTEIEEPGTEIEEPGTEIEEPGTETEVPETEIEEPGTEIEEPGTETEVPGTEIEEPETETEEPGTETETPGTATPGTERNSGTQAGDTAPGTTENRPAAPTAGVGAVTTAPQTTQSVLDGTHTHAYFGETIVPATAARDGKVVATCACGATKTLRLIPKIWDIRLSKSEYIYTGKVQKPAVTVLDGGGKVVSDTYYSVSYRNNRNVGTATVRVSFREAYTGTRTQFFKIVSKPTAFSGVTTDKKSMTLSWKQVAGSDGYELYWYTKNGKKNRLLLTEDTITQKKITGLKKGKTVYVRVRSYKIAKLGKDDKKYYSKWSAMKRIVIR